MAINTENWLKRATEGLHQGPNPETVQFAASITAAVYGVQSPQLETFNNALAQIAQSTKAAREVMYFQGEHAIGAIRNVMAEIKQGLIGNLRSSNASGRDRMRRREFVVGPLALYGAAALRGDAMTAVNSGMARGNKLGVKVLAFDVFGTVVDWRGSIIREGQEWGRAKGLQVDWGKFADRWREGYMPMMDKVRKGALPWMKLDALHRIILDDLLVEFQIEGLSEEEKEDWNHVWHRLRPWPDAVRGLERMKKNYVLATLSNGNVSLLVEMAKNAGLPWDAVLSAELFHHFKPDRKVYLGAVDMLGCKPAEVMMVAAHPGDLQTAHACGLRTGFVARPLEDGPGKEASALASFPADVSAQDFLELAEKLG